MFYAWEQKKKKNNDITQALVSPECDDFQAKEVGCDWLATSNCLQEITNNALVTYHRHNQDLFCPNCNGKQLIELC